MACNYGRLLPFNCSPEECHLSRRELNRERLDLWLSFAPLTAIIISPAMMIVVRYLRGGTAVFSRLGIIALGCPALSFLVLTFMPLLGVFPALIGVGISIIAIAVSIIKKLKSEAARFLWGDFLPLVINTAWCFLGYFYIIRFWGIFGD